MTRPSKWSPSIYFVKETGMTPQLVGSTSSMRRPVWKDGKERAPFGVILAPCSCPGLCGCHPGRNRFHKGGRSVPSCADEGHAACKAAAPCDRAGDSGLWLVQAARGAGDPSTQCPTPLGDATGAATPGPRTPSIKTITKRRDSD